jgi:hypothetical protein
MQHSDDDGLKAFKPCRQVLAIGKALNSELARAEQRLDSLMQRMSSQTASFELSALDDFTRLNEVDFWCSLIENIAEGIHIELESACHHARQLGFDDVSINIHSPESNTVDLVAAAGSPSRGFRQLRRRLSRFPALHDVEVCVLLSRKAEIFKGGIYDPRYDEYLWLTCEHFRYKGRLIVPILMIFDSQGCWNQDVCRWEVRDQTLVPVVPEGYTLKAIGTLSMSCASKVDNELALKACRYATALASRVYATTVEGIIAELARVLTRVAEADSATIHYVAHGDLRRYFAPGRDQADVCLVVEPGKCARREGEREPGRLGGHPRSKGMGAQAFALGVPIRLSGRELEEHNPRLWMDGVRSVYVCALQSRPEHAAGLVYFHRRRDEPFDENPLLEFLIRRSSRLLDSMTRELQNRRQAHNRIIVAEFMEHFVVRKTERNMTDLAWEMASALASMLGIDLVTVLFYDGGAATGGRFLGSRDAWNDRLRAKRFERGIEDERKSAKFVEEERIVDTVRVTLTFEGTSVGMLVADYREPHDPGDNDLLNDLGELMALAARVHQNHVPRARFADKLRV